MRHRKAFPCSHSPPPTPIRREAEVSLGSQLVTGRTRLREGEAAIATYFPNLLLRREDFGEELQVDLSVL